MMRTLLTKWFAFTVLVGLMAFTPVVNDVLIDFNFQSTTLPEGVTTSGTVSVGGSVNNCTECTPGRVVIGTGGFLQADVSSCSVFIVKMKSAGGTARTVTVKYKRNSDADYIVAGTVSVVQSGTGVYSLAEIFPDLVSSVPISVRLENAPSGGDFHIHDLYVEGNSGVSTEAEITAFKIPGQTGNEVINNANATIAITVPQGTTLTSVVPSTVTLSAGATLSPAADAAQDFSTDVVYTVTAEDGTTTKDWTVSVTQIASSEKEIVVFKLTDAQLGDAVINSANGTVNVSVPLGENISGIVPVLFTLSTHATIDPPVNTPQDFINPVVYTVTAQDNSTKQWTITTSAVDPDETFADYQAEDALFTGRIDNQHTGYSGAGFIDFLSTGENYIIFTVCQQQAGNRTAKFRYSLGKDEPRTASLYVNDEFIALVEFPQTATFTEWAEASATVALPAGISNIKLTWDETDGPNLDRLSLGGGQCASYSLTVSTTNSGAVTASPERANHTYFEGETVTLLAENKPDLVFANWSGNLTGTDNPAQVIMQSNKTITAHFNTVNTYTLNVTVNGIGEVQLDPPGGLYADGTEVTLTANSVLGSSFQGWGGSLSGGASPQTIIMNANKSVTATFTSNISVNFETPVGFASVVTGAGTYNYTTETFFGPTTGGQHAEDTLWINGPSEFDKLAKHLYDRNRAYRNASQSFGSNAQKAPLVIVLKEGVYPEGSSSSSAWGNHMMTIQEQGDLTIIGQGNVVLNWGFNIKRSWNILIRNITFQDYYDDGINIGETETHHIWIDHCTIGHPTTMPTNTEHPDGGIDVKAGASYVTISWCNYRNSWKTGLVGHSDSNESEDLGRLKVTYYGNYFYNTNSRNPRVRFGEVHVLNNLEEKVMLYGIAASNKSQVYAEGNFFLNTRWPMYADRATADFREVYGNNTDNTFTSKTGNKPATGLKQVNNAYDDSGLPVITAQINPAMLNPGGRSVKFDEHNAEGVFNPASYYTYTAFPASVVRTIVPLFAGAQKVDFFSASSSEEEGMISVTGTLESFTQTIGSPAATQTYTVSATGITGNLSVSPPANFEVSANGTDWFISSNPLTIASVEGAVPSTTVHVRLNASQTGTYSGNIVHAASGAGAMLLGVSGETKNQEGAVPEGTWTIYEANELPNAFTAPFVASQQSGSFSNTIVADPDKEGNNLLHMQTTANGDNNQWRQNLSGVQNITVVFRAKGNDAAKNLVFDADFDFGSLRWQMRILSNGNYGVANGTPNTGGSLGVDPLTWNTYRFTREGDVAALYVNENPTPVYTGTAASANTNNYFRFGDGWGSGTNNTSIDWIVWDVTGAYSPAETSLPASLTGGGSEEPSGIVVVSSLQNFVQNVGTPSTVQTYTVSAESLTENLVITPPTGYEISDDGGTNWAGSSTPLELVPEDGSVPETQISVRLNSAVAGPFSGSIAHTSAGVNPVQVSVTGVAVSGVDLPEGTQVIVAADGSGDFTTVQAAIDAAPTGRSAPFIIFIRNGVYKEKITVPSNKPFLQLIGESVANTILTYDDYSGKAMPGGGVFGTANSASVIINATDFTAINITFENTTGDAPQALAVNVNADRAAFKNCRFLGGQDTLLTNGAGNRQYFNNCYIDGVVDFIFGNAVAVFDSCVVYAKTRKDGLTGSYITAANTPDGQAYGYVFRNPILPSNRGTTQYVLGRPWQNSTGASPRSYPKVVFLNATMGQNIVKPEGWAVWDAGTVTSSIYYAEYKSKKFNGNPVNVSQRVPWSFQLTDQEADEYTNETLFGNWDPCTVSSEFCTPSPRVIAVSNFNAQKGTATTTFTWNISWPVAGVRYELFRSSDQENFTKVHEHVSINDTTINYSYSENVPPAGQTYWYYLSASKENMHPHITAKVEVSSVPTITTTGTLGDFLQGVGLPSAVQAYTLAASNLLSNLTVTPPAGYEISADGGTTWFTQANPLVLTPTSGTIASTSVSVRLNAAESGNYSGVITHTSTNAESVTVAVNGTVQDEPLPVSNNLMYWPLTANDEDDATLRSEALQEGALSFSRLVVSDGSVAAVPAYSELHGQAFGVTAAGEWSAAAGGSGGDLHQDIYEQLTITAKEGYTVRIDSLILKSSFYNTSSNTKLAILHSKSGFVSDSAPVTGGIGHDNTPLLSTANGAFDTPVLLTNETSGTTRNYRFALAGSTGVTLAAGETLTIRLYFSCSSTSPGRYGKVKDIYVKGFAEEVGVELPDPMMTTTGTLTAFSQVLGTPSAVQTYTVSGTNLTENITVTPPQHIEVSADGGASWRNHTNPLVLTHTEGAVTATVSVRLNASQAGTVNGVIAHTSTGAETKTVAVQGTTTAITGAEPDLSMLVKLYPNPVQGQLTLEHPRAAKQTVIVLYNQVGMKVGSVIVQPDTDKTVMDVTTFAQGIYFADYADGSGRVRLKFLKMN